jgi:hypothetical protein
LRIEKFCCSTFFWATFDRAVEPRVLELLALLHRALHQLGGQITLQEETHQVVLEREVELGQTRIALTRATTAQLAIDATRLVALGADYVAVRQGHARLRPI